MAHGEKIGGNAETTEISADVKESLGYGSMVTAYVIASVGRSSIPLTPVQRYGVSTIAVFHSQQSHCPWTQIYCL